MKLETVHEYCFMCRNYCHLSKPLCGRKTNFSKSAETPPQGVGAEAVDVESAKTDGEGGQTPKREIDIKK